jgi:ribosomal protein S9
MLKKYDLLKHDGRNVERKKPGLIKARKGPVYKRR